MGGLIGTATAEKSGLMSEKEAMPYNGIIPSNTDLNTLEQGSWIKTSASINIQNIPNEISNLSFLIEVKRFYGQKIGEYPGYYTQTITTQVGTVFRRIFWNNIWENWVQL